MSTKQTHSRRKILLGLTGGIAGASQLPSKWTKPIVNAVVLPAHAETSPPQPETPNNFRDSIDNAFSRILTMQPESTLERLVSVVIPKAHAGRAGMVSSTDCSINSPDSNSFSVKILVEWEFDGIPYGDEQTNIDAPAEPEPMTVYAFYQGNGTVGNLLKLTDQNGNNCFGSIGVLVNNIADVVDAEINGVSVMLPPRGGSPSNPGLGQKECPIPR